MVTLKFKQWRYSQQTISKVIEANYIKAGEKFVKVDGQNHGRDGKNNGTYRVTFFLTRVDGRTVKRSIFVSEKKLMLQNLIDFAERSNQVTLNSDGSQAKTRDSWHTVSKNKCSCSAFSNPTYGLSLNGFRVCKHTVALHKQRLGAKLWTDVVANLEYDQSELEQAKQQLESLKLAVEKDGNFKFSNPNYAHGLSFTIRTVAGAAIANLGYSTISGKFFYTSGMRGYSQVYSDNLTQCWEGFLNRNKYRYTLPQTVTASQIFPQ